MGMIDMEIKPGKYRGRIEDYGVFQSTVGQQHPTVFVRFLLVGRYDPSSGELGPCPAETREYLKAITPNTIGWLLSDLRAIGYSRNGLHHFDPEAEGAEDLFGREIDIVCYHETYKGSTRERWSISGTRRRQRVGADVLARLDAEHADALRKILGSENTGPGVTTTEDESHS
jgi:hypothetical protein